LNAVMKMIGIAKLDATRRSCNSEPVHARPLYVQDQAVCFLQPVGTKKISAEANVSTAKPKDFIMRLTASLSNHRRRQS